MGIDFSKIFHESSKDHTQGGSVNPGLSKDLWPESWSTIFYKTYQTKKIALPGVNIDSYFSKKEKDANLFSLIKNRKSRRDFTDKPLTLEEISILLQYSCGIFTDTGRRANPSGGGRYPIEVYIFVQKISKDIPSGLYHYNIKEHALDILNSKVYDHKEISRLFNYDFVQNASASIILTSAFFRTKEKYGERGYRYILLEAGHIVQNMYLVAEALELSATGLGGTKDIKIEKELMIDGDMESLVYSFTLG